MYPEPEDIDAILLAIAFFIAFFFLIVWAVGLQ